MVRITSYPSGVIDTLAAHLLRVWRSLDLRAEIQVCDPCMSVVRSRSLWQMFVITLVAGPGLFFLQPSTSDAGRRISLPFVEHLDAATSISDISWATQGGTVTWVANGGWRGSGGVKITAPFINGDQGYAGLGSFDVGRQTRLNVRFLIYFGSSFQEQLQFDKLLIVLREKQGIDLGSLRPMILDNQRIQFGREHRFWRACRGVVECGEPNGADVFTVSSAKNANQWVCFELESDLVAERLNLYIHTADGRYRGISSSVSLANERNEVAAFNGGVSRPPTDFPIYQVQVLGGFWNWSDGRRDGGVIGSKRDANAYIKIDEIAIDNRYIGCPAGFQEKPLTDGASPVSMNNKSAH